MHGTKLLRIAALLMVASGTLNACYMDEYSAPDAPGNWTDLGELPANLSIRMGNLNPLVVVGDEALIGTADGVWRRSLLGATGGYGGMGWVRSGLQGVSVNVIRSASPNSRTLYAAGTPSIANPLGPSFYRSDDGGSTWQASTSYPISTFNGATIPIFDLAIRPDDPDRIYANFGGVTLGVSVDGGRTIDLANGDIDQDINTHCVIHIMNLAPRTLFQGCEAPLDVAKVLRYDLDDARPLVIAPETIVAGNFVPGLADLSNRRPNSMASGPVDPGLLYVGLETGLIALRGTAFEWIFDQQADIVRYGRNLPAAYIRAIWVDPVRSMHLIFGGGVNGDDSMMSLFETFDHGKTIAVIDTPQVLSQVPDIEVEQLVPYGAQRLVVLVSTGLDHERGRVLIYNM